MDPNRLTQKTQESLADAQSQAIQYGHSEVDVEHLLVALCPPARWAYSTSFRTYETAGWHGYCGIGT